MEKKRHALRKLLEAVEHELLKKPNRKTLDRLSLLAGFQDWDSFQDALHGDGWRDHLWRDHRQDEPMKSADEHKKETPNE